MWARRSRSPLLSGNFFPFLNVCRMVLRALFKRPECTRLHLKIFPEENAPETPKKSAPFAVLMGAFRIATVYRIISRGPLYHKILRQSCSKVF